MIDKTAFYFVYNLIYIGLAYCSFFFLIYQALPRISIESAAEKKLTAFAVACFSLSLVIVVGFREFNVGTDTGNYYAAWLYGSNLSSGGSDFLFYYMMSLVKNLLGSYQAFLLIVAGVYYYVNYNSLSRFSNYFQANFLFVFFVFISLFFSLSTSINVVRQGLSLSFLLLGISFLTQNNRAKVAACFALSIGFHFTAAIPMLIIYFVRRFSGVNVSFYVMLFFLGVVLSFFNFSLLNISPVLEDILVSVGDKRVSYLDPQDYGYEVGFRPDFVFFNFIFLVIFLLVRRQINDVFYDFLLKYYCLSSFLFFMAFQLNFSDRFGLFSWFVIAPLLAPALGRRQPLTISIIVVALFLYMYFFIFK